MYARAEAGMPLGHLGEESGGGKQQRGERQRKEVGKASGGQVMKKRPGS